MAWRPLAWRPLGWRPLARQEVPRQEASAAGGFSGGQSTTGGFGGGGGGGLLGAPSPSTELVAVLAAHSANYTWAAAVVGSNNAAGYQLGTDLPVMAVGGFDGTDPAPTPVQFQALATAGRIHYFIGGSVDFGGRPSATSGSQDAALIRAWVTAHYPATTVGSVTIFDLCPDTGAS